MIVKFIQDPIWGSVGLTDIELEIIDLPTFQRLRDVSQLTGVTSAYPSATHTRFEHSMGAMYVARLYGKSLFPSEEKIIQYLEVAGLLHDIAHGPFSHAYDTIFRKIGLENGHDDKREELLDLPKLSEVLQKYEIRKEDIINIWNGKVKKEGGELESEKYPILKNLLSGPIGADRIDYAARDSYYTGTQAINLPHLMRIIYNSKIIENKLCYARKLFDGIFFFLFTRFWLYRNVYYHKTVRAAALMIMHILEEAFEPCNLGEKTRQNEQFINLNDTSLLHEIKSSSDPRLERAKDLIQKYKTRKLYKCALQERVPDRIVNYELSLALRKKIPEEVVTEKADRRKEEIEAMFREKYGNEPPELMIDTPNKVECMRPEDFRTSEIYFFEKEIPGLKGIDSLIKDEKSIESIFRGWLENFNFLYIYRIYVIDKEARKKITPLLLVKRPEEHSHLLR